jgi:hypothetical protein
MSFSLPGRQVSGRRKEYISRAGWTRACRKSGAISEQVHRGESTRCARSAHLWRNPQHLTVSTIREVGWRYRIKDLRSQPALPRRPLAPTCLRITIHIDRAVMLAPTGNRFRGPPA